MNRSERRKLAGINKRGIHRKDRSLLLCLKTSLYRQYQQLISLPNGGIKKITHVQFLR